jgi:TetR/AcrR family transcriptional regulator
MKGKPLDDTTALKIKKAAKEVFLAKGYDGATMQAIADKAGFNKAQLHYYFRNKDGLFLLVFKEEFQAMIQSNMPLIFNKDKPIREKLEAYIDAEAEFLSHYPRLPLFIISETHRNPELLMDLVRQIKVPGAAQQLKALNQELKEIGSALTIEELFMMLRSILIFPIMETIVNSLILVLDAKQLQALQARRVALAKELVRRFLP